MRQFLVCLCLAAWLANPGSSRAQNGENITGVLHKIDVKIGTITVRPGKRDVKEPKTFSLLRPDLEVVTELGRVRLTDLAVGNIVHLHLNDEGDVDAIRAEVPVVRAALTALDLPGQIIHVLADNFAHKAFTVTRETKIVQRGKDVRLADLKPNQWLEITATLDGKNALAIEAHAPGTRNGRVSSGKLHGSIIVLDVMTGTLLFHNTKGGERLLSFAVPRDLSTFLLLDNRPVDELRGPLTIASKPATLYLSSDRTQVKRILFEAPLVPCQISAVDIKNRRLTVNADGVTKAWDLPADVKVRNGRRTAKLEDLRADIRVDLVLSHDRAKVRAIVLANPQ